MRKANLAVLCFVFTSLLSACGNDDAIEPGADPDALGSQGDALLDSGALDAAALGDALTPADAAADATENADAAGLDAAAQDGVSSDATDSEVSLPDVQDALNAADVAVADADTTGADTNVACVPTDCSDGNPCTTDLCAAGGCTHAAIPGCSPPVTGCDAKTPCAAGVCNPVSHACVACLTTADCGGTGVCLANLCVAAPKCVSDVDCKATKQVCDIACVDCNSNTDCGVAQTCTGHKCVDTPPCKSSKDCAAICNLQTGTCVDCLLDSDCKANEFCSASTHACVADVCSGVSCTGATAFGCLPNGSGFTTGALCADGKPCTTDSCVTGTGCVYADNAAACDDGDACTLGDACAGGSCKSGVAVDCNDGQVCTFDSCNKSSGCVHTNVTAVCDDGLTCTSNDTCVAGKCTGTTTCDDANPCTTNSCDASGACLFLPATGACSDGEPCTAQDACVAGKCVGGTPLLCDDKNVCTIDSCVPGQGCVFQSVAGTVACDDGNGCTTGDTCTVAGACVGTAKICNDGNACTTDSCVNGACTFSNLPDGSGCGTFDGCTGDFCAAGVCLVGQTRLWEKSVDGPSTLDRFYGVSATVDGGFALVGDTTIANAGRDGWLVKLDAAGNTKWSQHWGSNGNDRLSGVVSNADGTLVAVGQTVTGNNSTSGWYVKTDATGNVLANTTLGGNSASDRFDAIALHPAGGSVGVGARAGQNSLDGWIVRWDANGNVLWNNTYNGVQGGGGQGDDSLRGLVVNSDGSIVAVGSAQGNNTSSGWILKVDASGNQVFSRTFGQNYSGSAFFGVVANGTGYAVAGSDPTNGNNNIDGLLLFVDAAGQSPSSRWFNAANTDVFYTIAALPTGGFLLAGSQSSNGGTAWYLRVDGAGNQQWSKTWGNADADGAQALIWNADNTATVAGFLGTGANAGTDGLARRVDAWGNPSCATSGSCLSKQPNDCDDANPCTFDACGQGACSHTNLPNGTTCNANGWQCDAGQCVAG